MNCPVCGKKVKSRWSWFGQDQIARCECGTRIRISIGIFKDKIVDWQTPKEAGNSLNLL